MEIRGGYGYTKDHEWVREDDGVVIMGVTDYAQHELGDVVFVDLPPVGKAVKKGDVIAVVESVKAASDVYAPISGKVVRANDALATAPETLNSSPYDSGWLVALEPSDRGEIRTLLDDSKYRSLIESIAK